MNSQADFFEDPNNSNYWRYWNGEQWLGEVVPKFDAAGRLIERPRSAESQGHLVFEPSWFEKRRRARRGY